MGKQNHRIHSDFSDEYVRKNFQTLFHKCIKRKRLTRGVVSSFQCLYQHGQQNSAGLEFLGRTFFPCSCLDIWWVYTDMTMEWCLKISKSRNNTIYFVAELINLYGIKNIVFFSNKSKYKFSSVQCQACIYTSVLLRFKQF